MDYKSKTRLGRSANPALFPGGCSGLVVSLGSTCLTDNGAVKMDFGKTLAVGATTSFKDSFIKAETHLLGVCLKAGGMLQFL